MKYDLDFHYRITLDGGDVYCQIKLGECETETRDTEMEKQTHQDVQTISELLGIDAECIIPVSPEEYHANKYDEEGER